MGNIKNSQFFIKLPIILAIGIAVGILFGYTMADPSAAKLDDTIKKFKTIIGYIESDYVDEVDTDKLVEEAFDKAINNTLQELDPHSVYIPPKETELVSSQLDGEFEGVGIEFNIFKDTIYVVAPLSGGPSEKLGIKSGDKIVKIDGESVAGINITNRGVIDRLRGKKGTKVTVDIKRKGLNKLVTYDIIRDKIPQYSVDASYMYNDEVGYIKISRFGAKTYEEFLEALTKLKEQGMKKLVLDLQSNPGGYMGAAIKISDEFISDNKLIVSQRGRKRRYDSEARAFKQGEFENGSLIVLINEGSASASEIVAGALQDNDRALIVGRRSFGKGLVQMPIRLEDNSEVRLTIARYYTPSGRSIQKPYHKGGVGEYESDLTERYKQGEFFHADSIKFNDSLKFKTLKGRTVYGGGGIMPDYFVSLDTSSNSTYLTRLFNSNIINEYTLTYLQKNKKSLKKMTLGEFKSNFEVTESMLKSLTKMAEDAKVVFDETEYKQSKNFIRQYVKAQIARGMWKNEGFYQVINEENEIFSKAITLFDKAGQL